MGFVVSRTTNVPVRDAAFPASSLAVTSKAYVPRAVGTNVYRYVGAAEDVIGWVPRIVPPGSQIVTVTTGPNTPPVSVTSASTASDWPSSTGSGTPRAEAITGGMVSGSEIR